MGKITIKQNKYDNWYGYEGGRKIIAFANDSQGTQEEHAQAWLTQKEDEQRGFNDRKAGFYDKWYRYTRKDDGAAYDRGVIKAVESGLCPEHFTLIECANAIRA